MSVYKNADSGTWYAMCWFTELRYADGTMISIDCTAVENEVADNMYQRSELDWLIYNAPMEYVNLVLNGDPEKYLKAVTEYKPLDS